MKNKDNKDNIENTYKKILRKKKPLNSRKISVLLSAFKNYSHIYIYIYIYIYMVDPQIYHQINKY